MKSKKGLIIVIVMFLIILAIGGTVLGLFLKTDLFKTEQQKFWKYFGQNTKSINMITFPDLIDYRNAQKENSVQAKSELRFNIKDNEKNPKDVLEKMVLESTKSFDAEKDTVKTEMKLMVEEHQLFQLDYIRDNDIYALEAKEIADAPIGIENNNLKEFAKNMGEEDVSDIPNKIETNHDRILQYPREKYTEIVKGYMLKLFEIIPKEKYMEIKEVETKVNGENTTANLLYIVLSEIEVKDIALNLLKYAKQDPNTQEYIKDVIKTEMADGNKIDNKFINEKIDEMIKIIEEEEPTEDEFLRINLYVKKQDLIKTEIVLDGESTVSLEYKQEANKENLVISTLVDRKMKEAIPKNELNNTALEEENNILPEEKSASEEEIISINFTKETIGDKVKTLIKNESEYHNLEIEFFTRGTVEQNDMKFEGKVTFVNKEDDITYNLSYENKPDFRKTITNERLNNKNTAILNSYSYENFKKLEAKLEDKISAVYKQKLNYIKTIYEEEFTGIPSVDNGMVDDGRITESGGTSENIIVENVTINETENYF